MTESAASAGAVVAPPVAAPCAAPLGFASPMK
jgi:hypothetical protein